MSGECKDPDASSRVRRPVEESKSQSQYQRCCLRSIVKRSEIIHKRELYRIKSQSQKPVGGSHKQGKLQSYDSESVVK